MRSLQVRTVIRRRAGGRGSAAGLSTWSHHAGSRTTVHVVGEVDLLTAPILQEALDSARRCVLASCAHPELLIDLREVSFLGAAGLSVLAVVRVRCVRDGTSMCVVGDQPAVRRPMELVGLRQLLATR
jgi:anti-anti-sigma factor